MRDGSEPDSDPSVITVPKRRRLLRWWPVPVLAVVVVLVTMADANPRIQQELYGIRSEAWRIVGPYLALAGLVAGGVVVVVLAVFWQIDRQILRSWMFGDPWLLRIFGLRHTRRSTSLEIAKHLWRYRRR